MKYYGIQEAVVHGFGMVLSKTRELVNVSAMLSGCGGVG